MSSLDVPVRSLVVEWRYDPNLAIYSVMDKVGIRFKESFPDWQRTPLTLELKDKKHRRQFAMAYNRCIFHVAAPHDLISTELEKACTLFDEVASDIDLSSVKRLGLRQWVAYERSESFKDLSGLFRKQFQPPSTQLLDALTGTVEDMSYTADVLHSQGWKYALRTGPMQKQQWFELVAHDEPLFESSQSFGLYKERFPDAFLYVDLDASKDDVPYRDTAALLRTMREGSHHIIAGVNAYLGSKGN